MIIILNYEINHVLTKTTCFGGYLNEILLMIYKIISDKTILLS